MNVLNWLQLGFGEYGPWAVFAATVLGSIPLTFVPEEAVMALSAYFASGDAAQLLQLYLIVFGTMLLGQVIMYGLGKWLGERVLNWFGVEAGKIDQLQQAVRSQSWYIHILVRFSSTYRAIVGVLTGMSDLKFWKMMRYELVIAGVKPAIYLGLGAAFSGPQSSLQSTITYVGILLFVVASIAIGLAVYSSRQIFT